VHEFILFTINYLRQLCLSRSWLEAIRNKTSFDTSA